ncbi:MAG: hypothetical protein IKX86_01190 [Clostridia bacterium]|nr:hypothetical protein [Clostridia bacterium]
MSEQIYTIPVSEAFDETLAIGDGCPFCRLFNKLEANEIDLILGASLMEPGTRIQTNKKGFCRAHYGMMLTGKNRLGLGLIIESHLNELIFDLDGDAISSLLGMKQAKIRKRLHELDGSCYVCDRLEYNFSRMLSNAVAFWFEDGDFRRRAGEQKFICLPHLGMWLETAKNELKKGFSEFAEAVTAPTRRYMAELKEDVSRFCRKFDYRNDAEPWGTSKDSLERAKRLLCGDIHEKVVPLRRPADENSCKKEPDNV